MSSLFTSAVRRTAAPCSSLSTARAWKRIVPSASRTATTLAIPDNLPLASYLFNEVRISDKAAVVDAESGNVITYRDLPRRIAHAMDFLRLQGVRASSDNVEDSDAACSVAAGCQLHRRPGAHRRPLINSVPSVPYRCCRRATSSGSIWRIVPSMLWRFTRS